MSRTGMRSALLIGVGAVIVLAYWLLDRSPRLPDPGHGLAPESRTEGQPQLTGTGGPRTESAEHRPHRSLRVRDLASGAGVSGLNLILGPHEAKVDVWSDEQGMVTIPAEIQRLDPIRVASETWTLCAGLVARNDGDIWVYRRVLLRGVVRPIGAADSQLPHDGFSVNVVLIGVPGADVANPSPYPWNRDGARRIPEFEQLTARSDAEGAFSIEIPACRGLVARCRAAGWCPAWCDIPVPNLNEQEVSVVLDVYECPVLKGRVLLAEGIDPARTLARANVLLRLPVEGFNPDRALLYGESVGSTVDGSGAFVQLVLPLTLTEDGDFAVSIPVRGGEVQITVHAPEHRPARVHFRGVGDSIDGIQIAPRRDRSSSGVVFSIKGVPAAGAHVALTDITDDPFQTLLEFRLDRKSVV